MERETIGITMSIGAAIGALAGKFFEWSSKGRKLKVDEATKIREELREQLNDVHRRMNGLYKDLDQWKGKYYSLAQENIDLRAECKLLRAEIDECLKSCPRLSPSSPTSKP